jgi:hypothetical protein
MLLTGTGKRRISSGVRVLVAPAALVIARAAELEIAQVPVGAESQAVAELELVLVVAELEHDPVAAELEIVQVVVELGLVRVVVELGHDLVAAVLEHDLGEAGPVPGHRRARLVVALKTRSVTAAHRRGLVPRLAAEDLVVVVETTRDPAAPEAATAWAAAGTAVAAAVIAVAVVAG